MTIVSKSGTAGFSTVELFIVIGIMLIITAIGLPSLTKTQAVYRVSDDARSIAESLTLAKMRAGANLTPERLSLNTGNNTYQLEQYNKTTTSWDLDQGVKYLNNGVSFGYGSISSPAGSQSAIVQTSPVIFNSRGIPVNGSNQPTPEDAIYLYNSSGYFAVTVALSGRIQVWKYMSSAWVSQ